MICGAKQPVEERWSDEVMGEVVVEEMTPEAARKLCLARAKARAIEQVAGEKILNETIVKDATMLADFVSAQSYAWVKKTSDVKWEYEDVTGRAGELPKHIYRVRLKGLVAVDRDRDSGFPLKLELNRSSYHSGDEMQLSVQSGKDAYITVFNILEDDKVTVLLPNKFKLDRFVKRGEKAIFPDPMTMGSKKMKLFKSSKSSVAKEAILVVATRNDIDLIGADFKDAVFAQHPSQTGLLQDILEKLMDIHPDSRAMAVQYYELKDKK